MTVPVRVHGASENMDFYTCLKSAHLKHRRSINCPEK